MNGRILRSAVVALALTPAMASAQIPAFPGADGAGRNATGGRGGLVYHVTVLDGNEINANSPGRGNIPGTLAYGVNDNNFILGGVVQPRTIVFDVGGTFWLGQKTPAGGSPPTEGWDSQDSLSIGSKITIAGQTAPGGVHILGGGLKTNGANAIVRNVLIAPGYGMRGVEAIDNLPDSYVYDAINISANNVMIDHVTTVFASDETISLDERANNVTIQYSNISQGQNYPNWDTDVNPPRYTGHALGSLFQGGTNSALSVHHNLYAHQKGRLPRVGTETDVLTDPNIGAFNDFRNNIFYNWLGTAGGGASGQPSQNNFLNNYYLSGNGGEDASGTTKGSPIISNVSGGTSIFSGSNSTGTKIFHSGNVKDTNKNGIAQFPSGTPVSGVANLTNSDFSSSNIQASQLWYLGQSTYQGVTETVNQNFVDRLLDYVGTNWWTRDATIDTIDERITHEVETGTGQIMAWNDPTHGTEWNAMLALRPASLGGTGGTGIYARDANWDADQDGMPLKWELEHELNPGVAEHNGDFDSDGYTNLEEYLNEIAEWPAPNAIVFDGTTNGRYAQITNWDVNPDVAVDGPWQPSKYDTAVINGSNTVTVDAVGQHAGNLILGMNASDAPTLNISNGWLKVEDTAAPLSDGVTVIGDNPASAAVLNLSGGKLRTEALLKGAAGTFNFTGGTLSANTVGFTLENNGGTIAPGESAGMTQVMGNLTLESGALEIEIGGTDPNDYDVVTVTGLTTLGGTLKVKLIDPLGGTSLFTPALDDEFPFLLTGTIDPLEVFDALDFSLAGLPSGLEWELTTGTTTFVKVVAAEVGLAGDFNGDLVVDAADYTVWRNNLGTSFDLGGNGDETGASAGVVDEADYNWWKQHYGDSAPPPGSGGLAGSVPEPATIFLLIAGAASLGCGRRAPH